MLPGGASSEPDGLSTDEGRPEPAADRRSRWDPSTMQGAIVAAVVGGTIVWLLVTLAPHIHIYWR
jgi:hypothetical protein